MGTAQPRRCGSCTSCIRCSVWAQKLTRREQEELGLIEANMKVAPETRKISFHYSLLRHPRLMTDNRGQAVAMAAGLERRLQRTGEIEASNEALQDFLDRGTLQEVSKQEMALEEQLLQERTQAAVEKAGLEELLLQERTQAQVERAGLKEQLRQKTETRGFGGRQLSNNMGWYDALEGELASSA